ncbi:hypothetical protein B8W67_10355 [Mycolicibacillus koreensis]|uniref:Uncharacterized protein n=1 Tax=Mycolicibacillus koreensis TaxID=1069220 RepID=A0AA91SRJ3_9MYCO|nr:hypothetical protein B8W67_10355 [Mycolicibacillus koreensis]
MVPTASWCAGARPAGTAGRTTARDPPVIWEYPRETPDGDQVDLVEVMRLFRVDGVSGVTDSDRVGDRQPG